MATTSFNPGETEALEGSQAWPGTGDGQNDFICRLHKRNPFRKVVAIALPLLGAAVTTAGVQRLRFSRIVSEKSSIYTTGTAVARSRLGRERMFGRHPENLKPEAYDGFYESDRDEVKHDPHNAIEENQPQSSAFASEEIAERLRPRGLIVNGENQCEIPTKQFVHLHHMKTGGTSINSVLRCGLSRLRDEHRCNVPFYSLSECGYRSYHNCISGRDSRCRDTVDKAAVMTYCAPLYQVGQFNWLDADIVTVLRDPIDRVWSMFRFQTRSCFNCLPLTEIYRSIDNGTVNDLLCGGGECESVCIPQLLDHQVRNLLTSELDKDDEGMTDRERLDEALHNLRSMFAVVGITEDLPTTARMIGHVFPWLNETYSAGAGVHIENEYDEYEKCHLPHANASPSNNRCGPKRSHWDLPDEPDEETRKAIIAHNQLDAELYKAAVEYFRMEKRVLGWE